MDRWQYLFVLGRVSGRHAPLELFGAGVYRQPGGPQARCCRSRRCSSSGTSSPSPPGCGPTTRSYITGLALPLSLPFEELLFFLVIPFCGLLTYDAVTASSTVRGSAPRGRNRRERARIHAARRRCGGGGVALELLLLRTGLFRRPAYWISMVIVFGFQIPVDGWLTKLTAPIVVYDEHHTSGLRVPVRHPRRGLPVRLHPGHRRPAAWERQRRATPGGD